MYQYLLIKNVWQGNCQCCFVTKKDLDDTSTTFQLRDKQTMLKKIGLALKKGIYPGWEKDRYAGMTEKQQNKLDGDPATKIQPHPILNPKTKEMAWTRAQTAGSRIGRHFMSTFYEDLEDIDLGLLVCLCLQQMSCSYFLILSISCCQFVEDPMHTVDLGLWTHIVRYVSQKFALFKTVYLYTCVYIAIYCYCFIYIGLLLCIY